ncbi:Tat pathway signal sequence domain protein [Streptomyces sp. NPDC006997]|uniref:Tat pathway signal sequence domain protein n=1 Tax=Streptomyces sp. NPDC006997 TaxID=3155356 RepID=UPI0033D58C70
MNGVGPVEPGEDTYVRNPALPTEGPPHGRLARLRHRYHRHHRAVLAAATATAVLAGGGYLYATRPHPAPVPPFPSPVPRDTAAPYPSQVVDVVYLNDVPSRGADFRFDVLLSVLSGPPVTVTRVAQPYAGLTVTSAPRAPFRTAAGSSRKIIVTMRVTECEKVPGNAGLPFLDVTLRNTRAIQTHSFILGSRYAQHLSEALQVACSNSSR